MLCAMDAVLHDEKNAMARYDTEFKPRLTDVHMASSKNAGMVATPYPTRATACNVL